MTYIFMAVFAALILACDQITKFLTVARIPFTQRWIFCLGSSA